MFFVRLLTEHPEYRPLFSFFKNRTLDQLIRHRDPGLMRQSLRTMLSLDHIFMNLHAEEKLLEMVYQLAYRHHGYGLTMKHFEVSKLPS